MIRPIPAAVVPAVLAGLLIAGCATQPVSEDRGAVDLTDPRVAALYRYYERWYGTPYRLGGTGNRGLDCSAFVQNAYQGVFDVSLPRTTKAQAASGRKVRRSDLRAGDLVFFKTGWFQRHVGIYLNGGHFIHASTSAGVTRSSLSERYWSDRYWKAMRVASF